MPNQGVKLIKRFFSRLLTVPRLKLKSLFLASLLQIVELKGVYSMGRPLVLTSSRRLAKNYFFPRTNTPAYFSSETKKKKGFCNFDTSSDCDPFVKKENKVYIPCGAIANSMFSGEQFFRWKVNRTNDTYCKDKNPKKFNRISLRVKKHWNVITNQL